MTITKKIYKQEIKGKHSPWFSACFIFQKLDGMQENAYLC